MQVEPLAFSDLFSGLGGFHVALSKLGHKCVFAAELDSELRQLYYLNFGIRPSSDIRTSWMDVPPHDVLCAGFPCQPFSKAGRQLGFRCPDSGDLFDYILDIVDRRRPRFLIFENVPNILKHANGKTWETIRWDLTDRGYSVRCEVVSPHLYGIPQIRYRAIIVASLESLYGFNWPTKMTTDTIPLSNLLDTNPPDADQLPAQYVKYLDAWEEFIDRIGENKLPSFPIWGMEFGATYPYQNRAPMSYSSRYLARFRGAFGEPLSGKSKGQQIASLPVYSRFDAKVVPDWKARFIRQNRGFYLLHEHRLRGWLPTIENFPSSFQKLEWNCQSGHRTLWDKVIQFRASGIRARHPAAAPSLVALTTSQVPMIAWERRYMSIRECARLQSLGSLRFLPDGKKKAFSALGNAVNSEVIALVAENLVGCAISGSEIQRPTNHKEPKFGRLSEGEVYGS